MLILATILSLLFILCDCYNIICNENQCNGTTINCPNGSDCTVVCNINGCDSAIINCPDGNDCSISIMGANAAKSSTINANLATKLHVNTGVNGDFQLQNATINCPIHGECYITCQGDTYASEVCAGMDIHAESCTAFTLRCESNNACFQVDVWCPKYNQCILIGEPSTAGMTQMKIYSAQGFNTVSVQNGKTGISIGTMYCMSNYSSSCLINGTDNEQCSASHICDNTSIPTTSIPTTSVPTTSIPTTSIPTTSIPTTSIPTTSIPTTSIPTTSVPTTSIPTTSIPTTSIPTTSIPTTSIPTTSIPTTSIPTTSIPTTSIPTSIPTTSSPSLFPTLPRSHEISEVLSTLDQSYNGEQDNEKMSDNVYMIMIGAILALLICIICVLVGIVWRKKLKNKAVAIIETNLSVETVNVEMTKNTNTNEQKSHEMNIVAEGDYDSDSEKLFGGHVTTVGNTTVDNTTIGNTTIGNTTIGNDLSNSSDSMYRMDVNNTSGATTIDENVSVIN